MTNEPITLACGCVFNREADDVLQECVLARAIREDYERHPLFSTARGFGMLRYHDHVPGDSLFGALEDLLNDRE